MMHPRAHLVKEEHDDVFVHQDRFWEEDDFQ
jgi:hypothetical protein